MSKVLGDHKVVIPASEVQSLSRERYNTHAVGHGVHENTPNDGFSEELLRYTPFTKKELCTIINTRKWEDPINIDRLLATFPVLSSKFDDSIKMDMTRDLLNRMPTNLEFPCERLAALFQDCSPGFRGAAACLSKNDTYRSLLKIGFSSMQAETVGFLVELAGKANPLQTLRDFEDLEHCKNTEQAIAYSDTYKNVYAKHYAHVLAGNEELQKLYQPANLDIMKESQFEQGFQKVLLDNGFPAHEINAQKNAYMLHHNPIGYIDRPYQGMTLILSCSNFTEYLKLLEKVVKDLVECKAEFAIANSKAMDTLFDESSKFAGHAVIIYEGPWNAKEFFRRNPQLVTERDKGIKVPDGFHMNGKIYGKYCSFSNEPILDPVTGAEHKGKRNEALPPFVSKFTIQDFIDACDGKPVSIIHSNTLALISEHFNIPYEKIRVCSNDAGQLFAMDQNHQELALIQSNGGIVYNEDYQPYKNDEPNL